MNNGAMLNAYPDSLGGCLTEAATLLNQSAFKDVFKSFYILPSMFHTDLDRGFSVISYDLNRLLASREALDGLRSQGLDLKLDFILNHLSVLSPQFQDILKNGNASPYRDFFIDWNAFWQGYGSMTEEGYIQPDDNWIKDMFFRKKGLPILMVRLPDGQEVPYWNTFYQEVRYDPVDAQDLMQTMDIQYAEAVKLASHISQQLERKIRPSDMPLTGFERYRCVTLELLEARRKYLGQMDLNLRSPLVWDYYNQTLERLAKYEASIIRLDAFAYAPKAPGMRNFLNEPDTWDVLERVRQLAKLHALTLLPEIHASYAEGTYARLAEQGYMIYDFFLPGLMIDAIENRDCTYLASWAQELQSKGIRAVNMLGCHDGIPMLDLRGMLPDNRIQSLIDLIIKRGGMIKNLHGQKNVYYQVNSTYYSALGADDEKLLLARAVQLFMPGKPQVWYLDLFAGENDMEAVQLGGEAGHKEINRTNLTNRQIAAAMNKPLVQEQLTLLRVRNTCKAFHFDAHLTIEAWSPQQLHMQWQHEGATASLLVDFDTLSFSIQADLPDGCFQFNR